MNKSNGFPQLRRTSLPTVPTPTRSRYNCTYSYVLKPSIAFDFALAFCLYLGFPNRKFLTVEYFHLMLQPVRSVCTAFSGTCGTGIFFLRIRTCLSSQPAARRRTRLFTGSLHVYSKTVSNRQLTTVKKLQRQKLSL